MSDDMLIHFSSNSSNQSDQSLPTKIAKLEARMVGKTSSAAAPVVQSQQPATWSANSKFSAPPENLLNEPLSSDSDDEDNGGEFLIQANTQKRRTHDEDSSDMVFEHIEPMAGKRQKIAETTDVNRLTSDSNPKRQSRGRGHSSSGRGRGSRASDQSRLQTVSPSNGQSEDLCHK